MRGFESVVPLTGLASSDFYIFSADGLHGCLNLRPTNSGLNKFVKPIQFPYKTAFPFPQIWEGNKYRIIVDAQKITINNETLFTNNGHFFDFEDFHDFVIGVSQTHVLYKNVNDSTFTYGIRADIPTGYSMINYKGQLLVGGITQGWKGLSKAAICWSRIGVADFLIDMSNVAGYTVLQKVNVVYKLLVLDDAILVYTDTGMFKCRPTGLAYGFVRVNGLAPVHENAIAGSGNLHLFYATDDSLYLVTSQEVKKLGYKWLRDRLNINRMRILFNEETQDFYLTDGKNTYVYGFSGMFQTTVLPTTLFREGITKQIVYAGSDPIDCVYLETPWLNFSKIGYKTLESFDLLMAPRTDKHKLMCISFIEGSGSSLKQCFLNDNLCATPIMTGHRFKITYTTSYKDLPHFEITSIKTRVKYVDKRNYRAAGGEVTDEAITT